MRSIVLGEWQSLTVGAEISIVADGTLVAIPDNPTLIGLAVAEWAITVDTIMNLDTRGRAWEWLVNGYEAVSRVDMT